MNGPIPDFLQWNNYKWIAFYFTFQNPHPFQDLSQDGRLLHQIHLNVDPFQTPHFEPFHTPLDGRNAMRPYLFQRYREFLNGGKYVDHFSANSSSSGYQKFMVNTSNSTPPCRLHKFRRGANDDFPIPV